MPASILTLQIPSYSQCQSHLLGALSFWLHDKVAQIASDLNEPMQRQKEQAQEPGFKDINGDAATSATSAVAMINLNTFRPINFTQTKGQAGSNG